MTNRVNVAKEFSRYPAGRYFADGDFSGQAFRARFLIPALKAEQPLIVELDGVRGYGSSFLEEAFGGLVREGYSPAQIRRFIELQSRDPSLIDEIGEYIDEGSNPPE